MNISFHWNESIKLEDSIKSQNQQTIEDTLKNFDFFKNCSGTIHVSYNRIDALCITLFGHIFCDKEEKAKFTCAPDGSNFRT